MADIERKLTTIIAADVVGFSRMMGDDETGTLDNLKACRAIIDGSIAEHHGRIFGAAGDSVIAEFSSPVQAVLCANEFQHLIADRNAHADEAARMLFRVGINIGDVIIDGDNLYGDGVNVAARLETESEPGGICVSAKVYDEVRRKLDLAFVDGGVRRLKNIVDPVAVYSLCASGHDGGGRAPPSGAGEAASHKPTVAVAPLAVIGADADSEILAKGLREDIVGGLARQTALSVVPTQDGSPLASGADFVVEGSVRAAGQRLRLSFTMLDTAKGARVWSERYDRNKDDLFDLEDEISGSVVSVIRVRLKALEFEHLRQSRDEDLSIPDLLSKAAGYFVQSPGHNDEAAAILSLAIERAPENSMAHAMMAFCRCRAYEHSPLDIPPPAKAEISDHVARALSADPSSYFARLLAAVVQQDLEGDFPTAMVHAEAAVELNPNFSQASAMVAILQCHLGALEEGLDRLRTAMVANREDPHRFRHQRELAVALSLAGRHEEAAAAAERLVRNTPELCRNGLVSAAAHQRAGNPDKARACVRELLARHPDVTLTTMRPTRFHDAAEAERFEAALRDAGLPDR